MNKKVDELVEWVAREAFIWHIGDSKAWDDPTWIRWEGPPREDYYKLAKQILSHHYLALIDRDAVLACVGEDGVIRKYKTTKIIPLAEELKEEV